MKERENIDKYLDHARELKKTVEHANNGDNNCSWNGPQRLGKEARGIGNQRKKQNYQDRSIAKIDYRE